MLDLTNPDIQFAIENVRIVTRLTEEVRREMVVQTEKIIKELRITKPPVLMDSLAKYVVLAGGRRLSVNIGVLLSNGWLHEAALKTLVKVWKNPEIAAIDIRKGHVYDNAAFFRRL